MGHNSTLDTLRTVHVDPECQSGSGPKQRAPGAMMPFQATSIEEELPVASGIYDEYEQAVGLSLDHLRAEATLEPEGLSGAIGRMTESMQRNPDAMLLLDGMREKRNRQVERALSSSILMMAFGRFLDFASERLEVLGLAGLFLDVGKNCVPESVLDKSGMLTPDEYQIVKKHVDHSVELVRAANGRFPAALDEIILQHHERQDGSGYPRRLSGDEISTEGSIAGIVDSFSALTLPRPFAESRSPSSALNLLHTMRGRCFDATLMAQFVQCVGGYPVGSPVELNTGEIGIVIGANRVQHLQPRVLLVLASDGTKLAHPQRILDLAEESETQAGSPYRIRRALPMSTMPAGTGEQLVRRLCETPAGAFLGSAQP